MDEEFKIISLIEEQMAVQFTGKVNVLSRTSRQYFGHILFKDGEIIQVFFHGHKGLKAFYQMIIEELALHAFSYVVEPEIVEEKERQIHHSYEEMKNKVTEVLKLYRDSLKYRPPNAVLIELNPRFIEGTTPVTAQEYEVLEILVDWKTPDDIYQHCQLLEHEITWALVNLRKKGALRIVSSKNNP